MCRVRFWRARVHVITCFWISGCWFLRGTELQANPLNVVIWRRVAVDVCRWFRWRRSSTSTKRVHIWKGSVYVFAACHFFASRNGSLVVKGSFDDVDLFCFFADLLRYIYGSDKMKNSRKSESSPIYSTLALLVQEEQRRFSTKGTVIWRFLAQFH